MTNHNVLRSLDSAVAILGLDSNGNPAQKKLKISVAALLWEMANRDGLLSPEEVHEVVRSLNREFQIMDDEAAELIEVGEVLRNQASSLNLFFQEVSEKFSDQQKEYLFELLWGVAEADKLLHAEEKTFAQYVRSRLGL